MTNQSRPYEALTSDGEILKNNAWPEAAAVYDALDMPWVTLVGQVSKAYKK
jgi:hypothetical protein